MIDYKIFKLKLILTPFASYQTTVFNRRGLAINSYVSYYIFGIRIAKFDKTRE